jgi:hypothetical protein
MITLPCRQALPVPKAPGLQLLLRQLYRFVAYATTSSLPAT